MVSLNHRLSLVLREQMVGLIKVSGPEVGVSIYMDSDRGAPVEGVFPGG